MVGHAAGFEQEAVAALASKGITVHHGADYHRLTPRGPEASVTRIELQHVTLVDRVIRRCMAKIGFNYLAFVVSRRLPGPPGSEWLLRADFDRVRGFVRHGDASGAPGFKFGKTVELSGRTGEALEGHFAAIHWERRASDVIATVSLLATIDWQVELAHSFRGVWWDIQSSHFWDLPNRTVNEWKPQRFIR
jgi:hypothetical protein